MSSAGAFTSTNRAVEAAPTPATLLNQAKNTGKVRVLKDQCFWTGSSVGQNSTMAFCTLPIGAIPIMTIIQPINASGVPTVTTNAVTGKVGYLAGKTESADPNALGAFTDLSAVGAAPQYLQPIPDGTVYNGFKPLNEARQISVICDANIEGVADSQGISLTVLYSVVS